MAQKHKVREIIQKALLDTLTLEEEKEHQQIEQQQRAKKNGMAIQMPPLNTALVEGHGTAYKNVEKPTDILQKQWWMAQRDNEMLLARLQETEAQLKVAQERLLKDDMAGIPHFPDKELLDQLTAKEKPNTKGGIGRGKFQEVVGVMWNGQNIWG